jgi:hypothetical protein
MGCQATSLTDWAWRARICLDATGGDLSEDAIDRRIVRLPERKIDAFDAHPINHLRLVANVFRNAAGLGRSCNYSDF